ncbi:MAG: type pilus assembly ATPase PilB, type pilus assembly protein PilB [Candidatus Parcubacteria bacterium]|jgi:type II secretory ATPase GspE/PulE/Tfp pilus assembly ATPase PilB-like protein
MPQFDDKNVSEKLAELRRREEESLMRSLAAKYGHLYINLQGTTINTEALRLITEADARASEVAIFEQTANKILLATRNPEKPHTKEVIAALTARGMAVITHIASMASLEYAWARYLDIKHTEASEKGVMSFVEKEIAEVSSRTKTLDDVAARMRALADSDHAHQVSEILEVILGSAIALHASDVHIEPEERVVRLRFRLDGVLVDVVDVPKSLYELLRSRLKLLSGLKLNQSDIAQDGRFTIAHGGTELDIRSSIIPGGFGESIVMRLLDPGSASKSLDDLGLNVLLRKVVDDEVARPNGMIVTTGPTGSGKTTALYALLRYIHTPEVKIITLEDPIEYKIEGIVQTQVSANYHFADGLRAVLRQDPDVILVGEIRDREVAETALHAAQTGHLVFSTLHTNSAAGAFPRLLDLGIDREMIGSAVNLVIGQRLVRILCVECRKERIVTADELSLMRTTLASVPTDIPLTETTHIYDAVGCDKCNNTGYRGRQGVFEGIKVTKEVSDAVIEDPRESTIEAAAAAQGIPTMAQDGILKVLSGTTSLEELKRVVDLHT